MIPIKHKQIRANVFILLLSISVCFTAILTGCEEKDKKEKETSLHFDIHIESATGSESAATPLAVHIMGETKKKEKVDQLCLLWPDQSKTEATKLLPGSYDIEYLTPINSDGSLYSVEGDKTLVIDDKDSSEKKSEGQKKDEKEKENPSVLLKTIPASEVTPDMLKETAENLTGLLKERDPKTIISNGNTELRKADLEKMLTQASQILNTKKAYCEQIEKSASAFVRLLESPQTYAKQNFTNGASISWSYSLASLSEDGTPSLLLNAHEKTYDREMDYLFIAVLNATKDDCLIINADSPLQYGVASAGGFRGSLLTDQKAIYYLTFSSGTGQGREMKYTITGNALSEEKVWEGNISENRAEDSQKTPLSLTPSWNKKILFDSLGGQSKNTSLWEAYRKGQTEQADAIQYKGTIRLFENDDSMAAFQGKTNPNPWASSSSYAILELDSPTLLMAHSGDGMGDSEWQAELICLDRVYGGSLDEKWNDYKDKHVTVQFEEIGWWPSDTSLPLGQPSFYKIKNIFED